MASTHQSDFRLILPLAGNSRIRRSGRDTAGEDPIGVEPENSHRPSRSDRANPLHQALNWKIVKHGSSAVVLNDIWETASKHIADVTKELRTLIASGLVPKGHAQVYSSNLSLLHLALSESKAGIEAARRLPYVERTKGESSVPRAFALAASYLGSTEYVFDEHSFASFLIAVQARVHLKMAEVWSMKSLLELVLLSQIAECASEYVFADRRGHLSSLVRSLQDVADVEWKAFFERTAGAERDLRSDPRGTYAKMDFTSRETYRAVVADLAERSSFTEREIAQKAVALARASGEVRNSSDRAQRRRTHVGYYLVDRGQSVLKERISYRPSVIQRFREAALRWSDFFYLVGIELMTLAVFASWVNLSSVRTPAILVLALLLLPALECAVATVNQLATLCFPPKKLAKLDFSKGIPDDCVTVVAIPALLTSEEQVRIAVQGLEIRFLANRDPNLHFALLSDLPDSTQENDEKDQLAVLCSKLIGGLNDRYGRDNRGGFFHFHRSRTYNASEELWMGWERKRGKLLDFNRFLLGQSDQFPIKTGNLRSLANVRYVITLDLDTQLPAAAGHKLVGTLAHPLNQAVINPASNTVVEGYGILQPRVDISVRSASRSRFASLLSGDTGVDLYTRAVSDVYQDLFGEGIFTGKGIYEVETFQKVLEHRFPCNAVLSHDLIEGAYARAGLVSDIEVVDDYPSHFSAFSRRQHRWVRGDWQIIFGLLPRIPDFFGRTIRNPLSHISRWKIVDNLRRSLMECAMFLLLLCGWLCLPGTAAYWTMGVLVLCFFPTYSQFAIAILTARGALLKGHFWKSQFSDLACAHSRVLFRLTFLCHQSLVTMDAVVRTLVRMKLTHKRLLQWETAADAESGTGKNVVDAYLKCGPVLSLAIGAAIAAIRPSALNVALPFLIAWALSNWICKWLDRPQHSGQTRIDVEDRALTRDIALRTWRFFREFSTREENWLIPDIVQEQPPLVAHRVSTTNLGLLLNARLAAHDLGFLTLTEFVEDTTRTLKTVADMPKIRGHLYNWYATDTLQPLDPLFVSTVDNGNLLCSLWTLKQGCLEAIRQPLFRPSLWQGIHDLVDLLIEFAGYSADRQLISAASDLGQRVRELSGPGLDQFDVIRALEIDATIFVEALAKSNAGNDVKWWARELSLRVAALRGMAQDFAPWLVGESAALDTLPELRDPQLVAGLTLDSAFLVYEAMCVKLRTMSPRPEAGCLREALERSIAVAQDTRNRLTSLASLIESMANEMEFGFLYDSKKEMLSIGYDGAEGRINKYHYDLLASEARAAVFAAVAKGEIPPESWFRLGRLHVTYEREDVLRSWSGTAFEYLLPCLWIRTYPNTLLDRCCRAAIRAQRKFVRGKGIPWGISESSCNERNPDGHYRYHAFGVPGIAMNRDDFSGEMVIAPYATFLALPFDAARALTNLRKMKELGWLSTYGFYEAADFAPDRVADGKSHELVRNWMAHHQGMSLVAMANLLCDSAMQRRFHAEPCVAAYERLLHEKNPRVLPREDVERDVSDTAPMSFLARIDRIVPHPGYRDLVPKLP